MKPGSKSKEKAGIAKEIITYSKGDLLMGTVDKEFRENTGQDDTVLATNDRLQMNVSTGLAGKELNVSASKDSARELKENCLMSMLTRGLEETIVPRWGEIALPPSQMTEQNEVESCSIGYVADEWDEEYDRGKRKKIRSSKHEFGGPNPFQEVATKKAKVKKANMDQSSSGNCPFRI
ncbi:hypothetical protein RJ639_046319 [Escallonia herrerae]|uniref:Uncharacterized protein n=1 Tax=Escallonia herrerae TaxID=1293975 RepID=A0AA89AZ36_9ASTE|nr:hypothetical protein RJ639_046319 [Escallonia herrerae]